jgi:Fe-S oxidoreductase
MVAPRAALAQLDEREDRGIDTCTTCPKLCRWACPVAEAEARETVSPHSLVVLSGLVKREIASIETAGDLPYHCTHCGACTEACLHKNDVPLFLSLARSRIQSPPSKVSEVRGHFGIAGNPQGAALDGVLARISEEADVALSRNAKSLYFPGCETLAQFPEAATALLRTSLLFGLPGVAVTPLSASCCGAALFFAGDIEGFRLHAERFAQQMKDVETLIVHDAACAYTMKQRYQDVGVSLPPVVVHVAEFLAERVGTPRARANEAKVAYSDTCSLARGLGLVEEPRAILAKLIEGGAIELPGLKHREVDCCGASGLLPLTAPETARAMGEARIQAFRESGAEELATFSPRCAAHLKSIEPSLSIVDVAMLLARL